jgi:hypothetical protein
MPIPPSRRRKPVIKRLAILLIGTVLFWVMLAYPVYRLTNHKGLLNSAVAATLCLLPASITLIWSQRAVTAKSGHRSTVVLAASGIRMGTVVVTALVLALSNPVFEALSFWISVLVFYLFTLTLEMFLLMAAWPTPTTCPVPKRN